MIYSNLLFSGDLMWISQKVMNWQNGLLTAKTLLCRRNIRLRSGPGFLGKSGKRRENSWD
jgi:hypothetical protein